MANPEHVKILQQGVDAWNNWRGENPRIRPDLSSEDLRGVNLNWIKFVDCDLRWVNLGGADLTGRTLVPLSSSEPTCAGLVFAMQFSTTQTSAEHDSRARTSRGR